MYNEELPFKELELIELFKLGALFDDSFVLFTFEESDDEMEESILQR